jgi:hypothetical protein
VYVSEFGMSFQCPALFFTPCSNTYVVINIATKSRITMELPKAQSVSSATNTTQENGVPGDDGGMEWTSEKQ